MSTLFSKPTKRYNPAQLISLFVFLALMVTLLVMPLTGNFSSSLSSALGGVNSTHIGISTNTAYSFSADQQYWNANCSHSSSSDSICDDIVSRSQSCSISIDSAYCTEYDQYLKQFAK